MKREKKTTVRINLALDPENYDFVKALAEEKHTTMTAFINALIEKTRTQHADIYDEIRSRSRDLVRRIDTEILH